MFNIGKRIRDLRKDNKMTMVELSEKIGITQPQLSRIENNVNMAQLDTIEQICKVFNITLADFFAPTDTSKPLTADLEELLHTVKGLTPEQIKAFTEALKTIKKG